MSGSSVKRKNSAGVTTSCKRKKDTEAPASGSKAGGASGSAGKKEVYCIVEDDGTVEDSKVWAPTMPLDMRRWLPEKMVRLIQASLVSERRVSNLKN